MAAQVPQSFRDRLSRFSTPFHLHQTTGAPFGMLMLLTYTQPDLAEPRSVQTIGYRLSVEASS